MGHHDFPIRTSRFRLGDFQLRLDPALEAEIQKMTTGEVGPRVRDLFLRPDWRSIRESDLDRMLRQPQDSDKSPPKSKIVKPRAGKLSDVMKAIWATPKVPVGVDTLLGRAASKTRRIGDGVIVPKPATRITSTVFLTAPVVAGILANEPTRKIAFGFLDGREVAVPKVPGFSVYLRDSGHGGAGAKFENFANSGLDIKGGASLQDDRGKARLGVQIHLMLDLAHWIPSLR